MNDTPTLDPSYVYRGRSLRARAGSDLDVRSADHLDKRLTALAERTATVARRLRDGDHVREDERVAETALGDLGAAARGWAGCSPDVAEKCRVALAAYYAAVRERADADAEKRHGQ